MKPSIFWWLFQLLISLDNLLLLANCICCYFPPCKGSKGLKQRRCFQILAPNLLNFTICPFLHLKSVPNEMPRGKSRTLLVA